MPLDRLHPAASLVAALTLTVAAHADDWPQFRGPHRDGHSTEAGLVAGWGDGGPEELWRVPIGAGFSGMAVVDGRLYTMDSDADSEYLVAYDAASGRELWRTRVGGLFQNDFGNGPRSTPTFDGGTLYALGSTGELAAVRASDGRKLWSVDFQEDFGAELPDWAFSSSPLVVGDSVVVEIGGSRGRAVGAFDGSSGELRWTAEHGDIVYSSPVLIEAGGARQIVFLLKDGLLAVSPTGKKLWTTDFVADLRIKPAPPVFVAPDLIFASASYDAGAKVVRVVGRGGSVAAEDVWQHRLMRNHFNGSVAVGGHLCGFDKAFLKCIDAATGETTWTKRGLGKGSLIVADGKLIVLGERGQLVLFEADPTEMVELASHQALTGRSWTQPAIADGVLYLRNGTEMVAFRLTAGN